MMTMEQGLRNKQTGKQTHEHKPKGNLNYKGTFGSDGDLLHDSQDENEEENYLNDQTSDTDTENDEDTNFADAAETETTDPFSQPKSSKLRCCFLWLNDDILWISSFMVRHLQELEGIRKKITETLKNAEKAEGDLFNDDAYKKVGLCKSLTPKDLDGFLPVKLFARKDENKNVDNADGLDEQLQDEVDGDVGKKNKSEGRFVDNLAMCIIDPKTRMTEKFCLSRLKMGKGKSGAALFKRWIKLCGADDKFCEDLCERKSQTEDSYCWKRYKELENKFIELQGNCGFDDNEKRETINIGSFKNTKSKLKKLLELGGKKNV